MTIQEALHDLGVTAETLSPAERQQLDRDGYLPLYDIVPPELVATFNELIERIAREEGDDAGKELHQEAGTDRVADLVNKDAAFDFCFTHPRVLAAIDHVLGGDFKLASLNSRAALPGQGMQGLHADWGPRENAGDYFVCNSIWLLDDFTAQNGATRIVPGTHRIAESPAAALPDNLAPHPDEVLLQAPAGTVVIFNSHTWHGGTLNTTDKPRRALTAYFVRRDQPHDQRKFLRPETFARLRPAARVILDVE